MSTVLVTGGCGFIGSNYIHHLLAADQRARVINFDALTYAGNLENLAGLDCHPRYEFVRGDVSDHNQVKAIVAAGVDEIVHFAAESHVDRSIQDSTPFLHSNVIGTQILLEAARTSNVRRFIQISTDEVYGSLGDSGRFTELSPLSPNSPYAASKASADLLARSYVHTHNLPVVITRCSNNYGPRQFPEKLIPLFITNIMSNRPVPVYGDGLNIRDWIHVEDHCAAIERVRRHGRVGEVYNIGGDNERTNLELTRTLLGILRKPESLIRFVSDRPGHDRRYAIDSSKIQRELGWRPQVTFEDGLRQTIAWYQSHSDWIERIRTKEYESYYDRQYSRRLAA